MDAMFAIQLERQKGRSLGVLCGLSQVQGNYVACNKLAITLSEGVRSMLPTFGLRIVYFEFGMVGLGCWYGFLWYNRGRFPALVRGWHASL